MVVYLWCDALILEILLLYAKVQNAHIFIGYIYIYNICIFFFIVDRKPENLT